MLLYKEVKEGVKRNDIVICDINRQMFQPYH